MRNVILAVLLAALWAAPAGADVTLDTSEQYDLGNGYTRVLVQATSDVTGELPFALDATFEGSLLQTWADGGSTATPLLDSGSPISADLDTHFLWNSEQIYAVQAPAEDKGSGNPAEGEQLTGIFGVANPGLQTIAVAQLIVPNGGSVAFAGGVGTTVDGMGGEEYTLASNISAVGAVNSGKVLDQTFQDVASDSLPADWVSDYTVQEYTDAAGDTHNVLR
ncbi:MAG: hypothetical protein ACOC93_03150, partial [Planctomycetota bacterium]